MTRSKITNDFSALARIPHSPFRIPHSAFRILNPSFAPRRFPCYNFAMAHFNKLHWHKLNLSLRNIHTTDSMEHPARIFQSMVKNITNRFNHYPRCRIVFHIRDLQFSQRIKKNGLYLMEVLFFGHTTEFVSQWQREAREYFLEPHKRNFRLEDMGPIRNRNYEALLRETGKMPEKGEVCLDFLYPLSFTPPDKKRRFFLSEEGFLSLFRARLENLFGQEIEPPPVSPGDFTILPCYWKFDSDKQSPRDAHKIKGCTGRLYIKGDLKNVTPFLVLGAEIHTGGKLSYSHGYYRLLKDSPPFLAPRLKDKQFFFAFGRTILSESDKRFEEFKEENKDQGEGVLLSIWDRLNTGCCSFSPNQAFMAGTGTAGKKRLIENPSLEDFIVQRFLLKIVRETMEKLFEDNSLGYRKGKSVDMVFSRIETLLDEGYHYIFESDVEDFFPSIVHKKLQDLLVFYFPEKDHAIIDLILKLAIL